MKLIEVPPLYVSEMWPVARSLVATACERSGGRYNVGDILEFLLQGHMQLWIMMENNEAVAVAIAEIVCFPRLKECRILAATGHDMDKWIHFIEYAEEWARERGCTKMLAITRPGWERPLKEYGYVKGHVQLEKDLGYVH